MNTTIPEAEVAKKYFTAEEANQTLPLVKLIIRDITELYADIRERRDRLTAISKNDYSTGERDEIYSDELQAVETSIYEDIERLKKIIAELTGLGIELKDPETGLIDFPCLQDGREVCLCWKHGEDGVDFWHEIDAGFAGRQAL